MKKLFLSLLLLVSVTSFAQVHHHGIGHSQSAVLSVVSFDRQPFWLFIDDVLQNERSVNSIEVYDMGYKDYFIRVELDNADHNSIGQMVNMNRSKSFSVVRQGYLLGLSPVQVDINPEMSVSLMAGQVYPHGTMPVPPQPNVGVTVVPVPVPNVAMGNREFNEVKDQIRNESFDNSRLTLAKQIVSANPMTADQIKEICKLFSFESNALEFAKTAYTRCINPEKYYVVNRAFKYEASKRELDEYIRR